MLNPYLSDINREIGKLSNKVNLVLSEEDVRRESNAYFAYATNGELTYEGFSVPSGDYEMVSPAYTSR